MNLKNEFMSICWYERIPNEGIGREYLSLHMTYSETQFFNENFFYKYFAVSIEM